MTCVLPKSKATELYQLIRHSNYQMATFDNQPMTEQEAIEYINTMSDEYHANGIAIIFGLEENKFSYQAESITATYVNGCWKLEDESMGGIVITEAKLITAIHRLRDEYNGDIKAVKFNPNAGTDVI